MKREAALAPGPFGRVADLAPAPLAPVHRLGPSLTEVVRATVAPAPARAPSRVCFLYIAQAHQVPHSISAAVELARLCPDVEVHVAATSQESLDYARELVAAFGGAPLHWRFLGRRWLKALTPRGGLPPKLPILAANLRMLAGYDVIVTPERTTAALRLFGLRRQKLVYTQHGAGDRAGPFEPRLKLFDLVFAAGAKQRDRMVEASLVQPGRCVVVGYPKFDVVERTAGNPPRLFAEARPVVLYNPHFDRTLSSWPAWGLEVLKAFADQDSYNLIFAPHVRLFGAAGPLDLRMLAPFRDHPAIHIDLGARASLDMTYTRMADIYLGDVSSQVYEFLQQPKPCLFLNAHDADWRGQESYRHWRFGPVLDKVQGLVTAVDAARVSQAAYAEEQVASFNFTFARTPRGPSSAAAEAIARLIGLAPLQEPAVEPIELRAVG